MWPKVTTFSPQQCRWRGWAGDKLMMTNHNVTLSLLLFILLLDNTVIGCQSCLAGMGKNALFGFKKKDGALNHVDGDDSSNKDSMHIHNNALPLGRLHA